MKHKRGKRVVGVKLVSTLDTCPCGSSILFQQCCEPLLSGSSFAKNAEELMRSRFCAYATANYRYILETYSPAKQKELSIDALRQSDSDSQWLKLTIHNHQTNGNVATVEFSAFYRHENEFYILRELSSFNLIDSKWYYTSGEISPDSGIYKLTRNEPCLCGSGKKYKHCCKDTL